ncbi:unnamed protein product [Polarella glacialis]|uniref:Uncharacterized protein n=1 Tax=Polarella glacialis TaxID=89957 RepID=A0A813LF91_POLGL|nr:unnamed protein product [Polarella glacialis]
MSPRDQRPGAKVQRGMHELRHPPIQRFPSYPAPTSQQSPPSSRGSCGPNVFTPRCGKPAARGPQDSSLQQQARKFKGCSSSFEQLASVAQAASFHQVVVAVMAGRKALSSKVSQGMVAKSYFESRSVMTCQQRHQLPMASRFSLEPSPSLKTPNFKKAEVITSSVKSLASGPNCDSALIMAAATCSGRWHRPLCINTSNDCNVHFQTSRVAVAVAGPQHIQLSGVCLSGAALGRLTQMQVSNEQHLVGSASASFEYTSDLQLFPKFSFASCFLIPNHATASVLSDSRLQLLSKLNPSLLQLAAKHVLKLSGGLQLQCAMQSLALKKVALKKVAQLQCCNCNVHTLKQVAQSSPPSPLRQRRKLAATLFSAPSKSVSAVSHANLACLDTSRPCRRPCGFGGYLADICTSGGALREQRRVCFALRLSVSAGLHVHSARLCELGPGLLMQKLATKPLSQFKTGCDLDDAALLSSTAAHYAQQARAHVVAVKSSSSKANFRNGDAVVAKTRAKPACWQLFLHHGPSYRVQPVQGVTPDAATVELPMHHLWSHCHLAALLQGGGPAGKCFSVGRPNPESINTPISPGCQLSMLGIASSRNYSPACVLVLNRDATCSCISGASLHATCSGPAMLCKHSLLSKVVKVASLLPQAVKGASFLSVDPLVAACPPKQMSISAPQLAVVAAEGSPTGLVPLDSKVFVAQSLGKAASTAFQLAREPAFRLAREAPVARRCLRKLPTVPTQGRQPVCISGGRKCSVPAPPTTPPSPWMHSLELILLTPDMHAHDAAMVSSASEACYEVASIADFTLQGTLRDFKVCSNSGGPVGALKHLGGSSYKRLSLLPQDLTRTRLPGQTTNFCQAARTLAVAYEFQDPSTFLPLAFSYARITELPAVTSSLPVVALQSTPWLLQPPASMLCGVGPKLTGADCARAQGSKWAGIDASSCAAEVAAKALLSSRRSPLSSQQDLTSCLQSDLAHDAGLAVSEECKQLPALIKVYHRGGATARLIIKEVSIKKAPQIAAPLMPAPHPCATRASVQQVTLALNCGKRSLAVKPPCRCLLPCHGGAATCCPGSQQLLTHAQGIFASTRCSATPVLCHLLSERLDTLPSAHAARVAHLHFRWAPISGVIEKTAENRAVRVRPCSVAPTCRVPLFSQPLPLLAASSFVTAIPSVRCNNREVQQQLKSSSRLINVVPDMPLRCRSSSTSAGLTCALGRESRHSALGRSIGHASFVIAAPLQVRLALSGLKCSSSLATSWASAGRQLGSGSGLTITARAAQLPLGPRHGRAALPRVITPSHLAELAHDAGECTRAVRFSQRGCGKRAREVGTIFSCISQASSSLCRSTTGSVNLSYLPGPLVPGVTVRTATDEGADAQDDFVLPGTSLVSLETWRNGSLTSTSSMPPCSWACLDALPISAPPRCLVAATCVVAAAISKMPCCSRICSASASASGARLKVEFCLRRLSCVVEVASGLLVSRRPPLANQLVGSAGSSKTIVFAARSSLKTLVPSHSSSRKCLLQDKLSAKGHFLAVEHSLQSADLAHDAGLATSEERSQRPRAWRGGQVQKCPATKSVQSASSEDGPESVFCKSGSSVEEAPATPSQQPTAAFSMPQVKLLLVHVVQPLLALPACSKAALQHAGELFAAASCADGVTEQTRHGKALMLVKDGQVFSSRPTVGIACRAPAALLSLQAACISTAQTGSDLLPAFTSQAVAEAWPDGCKPASTHAAKGRILTFLLEEAFHDGLHPKLLRRSSEDRVRFEKSVAFSLQLLRVHSAAQVSTSRVFSLRSLGSSSCALRPRVVESSPEAQYLCSLPTRTAALSLPALQACGAKSRGFSCSCTGAGSSMACGGQGGQQVHCFSHLTTSLLQSPLPAVIASESADAQGDIGSEMTFCFLILSRWFPELGLSSSDPCHSKDAVYGLSCWKRTVPALSSVFSQKRVPSVGTLRMSGDLAKSPSFRFSSTAPGVVRLACTGHCHQKVRCVHKLSASLLAWPLFILSDKQIKFRPTTTPTLTIEDVLFCLLISSNWAVAENSSQASNAMQCYVATGAPVTLQNLASLAPVQRPSSKQIGSGRPVPGFSLIPSLEVSPAGGFLECLLAKATLKLEARVMATRDTHSAPHREAATGVSGSCMDKVWVAPQQAYRVPPRTQLALSSAFSQKCVHFHAQHLDSQTSARSPVQNLAYVAHVDRPRFRRIRSGMPVPSISTPFSLNPSLHGSPAGTGERKVLSLRACGFGLQAVFAAATFAAAPPACTSWLLRAAKPRSSSNCQIAAREESLLLHKPAASSLLFSDNLRVKAVSFLKTASHSLLKASSLLSHLVQLGAGDLAHDAGCCDGANRHEPVDADAVLANGNALHSVAKEWHPNKRAHAEEAVDTVRPVSFAQACVQEVGFPLSSIQQSGSILAQTTSSLQLAVPLYALLSFASALSGKAAHLLSLETKASLPRQCNAVAKSAGSVRLVRRSPLCKPACEHKLLGFNSLALLQMSGADSDEPLKAATTNSGLRVPLVQLALVPASPSEDSASAQLEMATALAPCPLVLLRAAPEQLDRRALLATRLWISVAGSLWFLSAPSGF